METIIKIRIIFASLLWIAFADTAMGSLGGQYYVGVNSSGSGYVYASSNEMDYDNVPFGIYDYYGIWNYGDDYVPEEGTPYWIYAKPEEGWQFTGWKRGYGFGDYEDEIFSTSTKLKMKYGEEGNDHWMAIFTAKEEFSLSGVPDNFIVSLYIGNWDYEIIYPDENGVYTIGVNREVNIEWNGDDFYYCSFNPEVDFTNIERGVTFTMPWNDLEFSATYKGYMLKGVPDDVSVFVDNNKASPDADSIYYILPDVPVKIEWTGDVKYTLDKDIKLTDVQENSISFNMPKSNLKLISKEYVKLNEDENSTSITGHVGETREVILMGHTLYQDGYWNTLCLPFGVDNLAGTPLAGFKVKQLDTATENNGQKTGFNNGTLYLNFKDATSITAGLPYIAEFTPDLVISSKEDWDAFAQNVSDGMSYEGKVVSLDADITVSTMAGTLDCPFSGTFDGNGHTIKLNLVGDGEGLAPFYSIDAATIQNVKVTGTVISSNYRPASLTSFVSGNSTIKNCWSSVDIISLKTSGWIDGGAFVARVSSGATLNMQDCAFTGTIVYNGGTTGGGMVGYTQPNATVNLTNCLFSPLALTLTVNDYNPRIFVSGDVPGNLTNCYYNAAAQKSPLENEGIDGSSMSNTALATALGACWEVRGKKVLPKCTFIDPVFKAVTFRSATPTAITSDDGAVSFKGIYNSVNIDNEGDNTILYMGDENTLYYPAAGMKINSFHAYFQLNNGLVCGNPSQGGNGINALVLNFGDETNGIVSVLSDWKDWSDGSDAWYSIDGRRLSGKPTQKGIYINNGKKVVIK